MSHFFPAEPSRRNCSWKPAGRRSRNQRVREQKDSDGEGMATKSHEEVRKKKETDGFLFVTFRAFLWHPDDVLSEAARRKWNTRLCVLCASA